MKFRKLGSTDLELSVITFGAWAIGGWMWGGTDRTSAIEAIRASWEAGATSIDTAPIYGMGLSEELVAEALEGIPRDKVQLLTKFGLRWRAPSTGETSDAEDADGNPLMVYRFAGRDSIIAECEDSLRRLKTDYIDLYQLHWPDSATPIDETMEAVVRLLEQGKIRYAAVCNYNAPQMAEALKTAPIVANQVPYSMVLRDIEKEVVPFCLDHGLGILAYSPLQRGLLTGKIKPGQSFPSGDHRDGNRYFTDEFVTKTNQLLTLIRPIAERHDATLAQLVLAWTLEQPGITVALAGARNAEQAKQNAKAADVHLSLEEVAEITALLVENGF
jgi:aryl-alcohol dehydrogenase-like predicted oxidoreductase